MKIKKFLNTFSLFLLSIIILLFQIPVNAEETLKLPYNCKSYVLMDEISGKILAEYNSTEELPPASLTKIMLMLILAEKIENENLSLDDEILTTSQHAKDMEGSKFFLEVGEKMTLREALEAVALPSANDAAVALAEYVCGSEENAVVLMNKVAKRLGMENTHFANASGLHSDDHYSSAKDVAIMSRELLLKHGWIKKITSNYSTNIKNKVVYNRNKLVRFYDGCTGLKTGSTEEAGYCLSASATRGSEETNDKMSLISVCLGVPYDVGSVEGGKEREENCKYLLDYGFSSFKVLNEKVNEDELKPVKVLKGKKQQISIELDKNAVPTLVKKGTDYEIEKSIEVNESVSAPVEVGQVVGEVVYKLDEKIISKRNIVSKESVEPIDFLYLFSSIVKNFFTGKTI